MPLDPSIQNALANEARRQAAALRAESLRGQMAALSSAAQVLGSLSQDAGRQYATANQELAALQIGAGPGLTDDFCQVSTVDQLLRTERFTGKAACIDYVKEHPECLEAEAVAAWRAAGMAATGLAFILQDPEALGQVYRANLLAAGLTPDATWQSQRAWIIATDKAVIMGA